MDLALTAEQEEARRDLAALLARECSTAVVRRAEPLGFDGALWQKCQERLAVAVGGPLLDAALAAEEYGRVLAPIPVAETIAARRLLADLGRSAAADVVATIALTPPVDTTARLVPAGAVASVVVVCAHDDVVVIDADPPRGSPSNLGTSPVADVDTRAGTVVASGPAAVERFERALDEWRVLTAALLVGLADGALDLAVAHVSRREQFGVPIGSFQSVQHRLADLATERDGARLLVWEAAWAADAERARASALAAMAFWWSARTAEAVTTDALHFHGGYGFTLAHDIQLYFRRAKAWPLALGDPEHQLLTVAGRCFGAVDDHEVVRA